MRKAMLRIILSISVCLTLYGILLATVSIKELLFSLLGFIPIMLGYFGFVFRIDKDGIGESLSDLV